MKSLKGGKKSSVARGPERHVVRFYDRDDELVAELAGVVVEALTQGDPMLCVATPEHREALEAVLAARGVDVPAAREAGAYRWFDAEEMLASVLRQGWPDAALFESSVGAVLDDALAGRRHAEVYGEMVALLWQRGEQAAAIEIEHLWNDLGRLRDFSLLCAYPTTALEIASLDETNRVCALHSDVLPPASYGAAAPTSPLMLESVVLVPVPEAVPAARRFMTALLPGGVERDVAADAALVVSELATNAVLHARSAFRLSVRQIEEGVRVTVQDNAVATPRERRPAPDDFGGRGVAIVGQLADKWGYDLLADGKVVWAELFDSFGDSRSST